MTTAFTLRALIARWRRLAVTALTVAFGVASVTGALVFTDTTHAAYRHLFSGADRGAQLIVSARQSAGTRLASGAGAAQTSGAPAITPKVVRAIRGVDGVRAAAGQIVAPATIVGADGRPLNSSPQTIAISKLPAPFNGTRYTAGGPPTHAGAVAIDASTAAQQHWRVGDEVTIVTGLPAARFRISGIATFGASGGERFAVFTPDAAHRLYASADVSQVDVAVRPGASLAGVSARITALLPAGLVLQSQVTQVDAAVSRVSGAFSTLSDGLLAFAVVAVLIGALVIFNTFATTATQRQRELALLRALGATRLQVAASGLIEAVVIGVLGAVLGAVAGPFLALAVRALFAGTGVGVASGALALSARAVGVGLGMGIGVSLAAAMLPALRAGRAAPVEALRTSRGALARPRPVLWTLLELGVSAGLGAGGLLLTLSASGDRDHRLLICAIGGGLVLIGALILGPLAVAAVVWLAGRRRSDPIFELARAQALVNRGRTALSGSSLMIATALALVVSVYVSGLRSATTTAIHATVVGDVVVESQDAAAPIPAASVRAVAAVPDLAAVSALKTLTTEVPGAGSVQVAGIDPTSWPQVYRFSWARGQAASVSALAPGQVLVEADTARAAGVTIGSTLALRSPTGRRLTLTVAGVYRDSGLLKGITVPLGYFDEVFNQPQLQDVFVKLSGSVSRGVALTALRRSLARFPGVVVRDQRLLAARLAANVTNVVDLLYALLILAVLMSLLGIGGSLNLMVQTRSAELGMLRALGMTPRQAAAMVRDESLLTALVGGIGGVVLGLVLSVCLTHTLAPEGFSFTFPWAAFAASILAMLLAGFVAALGPARRAGRMPMLAAIAYE
jgi:putative ABC transport system permease protein